MSDLSYSTAGLLFPAISLLMLAYTNRFLALASLTRHLVQAYRERPQARLKVQVDNLRLRLAIIRHTQALGVISLLFCTLSIFALFTAHQTVAQVFFALSMLSMLASLSLSLYEVYLSGRALNAELNDLLPREDS